MNPSFGESQDEHTVVGFEIPKSPESSYNNAYPGNEDVTRDPPLAPLQLHHTIMNYPASANLDNHYGSSSSSLPEPQNVILNHLYIETRETSRPVVALGLTHRFRSKYVTVVLYKPVQRRGSTTRA